MGKRMRKEGTAGAAIAYISRKQAMKKLQLSLKDFRRLCIIKGIYPVEPKDKKKVSHGSTAYRTFYYLKDIQFMSHDPLIDRYRSLKIMLRKVRKARDKGENNKVDRLYENLPTYTLAHVIKERYPSFHLALEELSDALSHCALFSTFPKSSLYPIDFIHHSTKVTTEFMLYVIQTRALRKVFVSIKGIYYEAEVMGQQITWAVPHRRGYKKAVEVDYHVLTTFVEFYIELLRHVNAKLYRDINLFYPPKLATSATLPADDYILTKGENLEIEQLASLAHPLQGSEKYQDDEDKVEIDEELYEGEDEDALSQQREKLQLAKKQKKLFEGLKFFLNREVPFEPLVFCIRSSGGQVSWERTMGAGATFPENDSAITHQIVDRPSLSTTYINRHYVQPQWVFDSLNAGLLLPEEKYFMGVEPPPHLSPFVEEKEGDYMPPEKKALLQMKKGEELKDDDDELTSGNEEPSDDDSDDEDDEEEQSHKQRKDSKTQKPTKKRKVLTQEEKAEQEAAEAKRMAIMMMPKKSKKLFTKIMKSKKHQRKEVDNYIAKRKAYEKQKTLEKKIQS